MAKVVVKVLGGSLTEVEADTVGELKDDLDLGSHSASVNGSPADDSTELSDGQIVALAPSVKGGKN